MTWKLYTGDCRDVLPKGKPNIIDAVVTDPPYGLEFMGKGWDKGVPGVEFWRPLLRIMKPGAHGLVFGGTRTHHRLMCALEDTGFEIRDCLMWVYGSGFPKSLDIGKAIDKAAGVEREVVRKGVTYEAAADGNTYAHGLNAGFQQRQLTAPATPSAIQWDGWGTALKPAWEPIILVRKPLEKGCTVAQNVLKWGVGGLNIDGCRVGNEELEYRTTSYGEAQTGEFSGQEQVNHTTGSKQVQGRWPANLIHDGSEEVLEGFPHVTSGKPGNSVRTARGMVLQGGGNSTKLTGFGDSGSASRFFYCAKASTKERGEGNTHPTVKPLNLLDYLITLITPPGGIVLDPFAGSGSTLVSADSLGFRAVGIEISPEYCDIARSRLNQ